MIVSYKEHLEQLNKEHEGLLRQFERAGIANRGDIQNEIDKCESNIKFFEQKLADFEKAETPNKIQIFCYVIVSNKEHVKNNIGEECFCLLEPDRYDDAEIRYWKPFSSKEAILNILQEFKSKTGYQFEEQYLDGQLSDEQWINIDDNKKNSVVIIDLLSLYEENKIIASRFDTEEVAGILTPSCRNLIKHDHIFSIMQNIQSEVFRILRIKMKTSGCSLFESDISEFDNFYQKLLQIFKRNFPIKNKIATNSAVRGFKISLQ